MTTLTPEALPHPESPEGINLIEGRTTVAEQQVDKELAEIEAQVDAIFEKTGIERDGTHRHNRKAALPDGLQADDIWRLTARMHELGNRKQAMAQQRRELARYEVASMPPSNPVSNLLTLAADPSAVQFQANGNRDTILGALNEPMAINRVLKSAAMLPNYETAMPVAMGADFTNAMFPAGKWQGKAALMHLADGRQLVEAAGELTTTTFPGQSIIQEFVRAPGRDAVHLQLARRVPVSNKNFRVSIQTTRANIRGTTGVQLNNQGEGESAEQSEIAYTSSAYTVERTSRFHKVSVDQLRDEAQAEGIALEELQNFLRESVSTEVLRGDGTDNTSNGISNATAWPNVHREDWSVAAARIGNTVEPNDDELQLLIFRVIPRVLKNIGKVGKARASMGSCSWEAWQLLIGLVDDDSRPIMVHPADRRVPMVHGVALLESDEYLDPADNAPIFTFADWMYCQLYTWGDVETEITREGNDARLYMRTLLAAFWNRFIITRQTAVGQVLYNSA